MIRCESCSSASLPKVMHPRHNSETIRPVFPKRRYSINVRFPFFFVQTIVPYALSQCDTYEQHDSEAMEGEVRRCAGYVRRVYGLRTSWLSPRVALRLAFPVLLAGRHSCDYDGDGVPVRLSSGRGSHVPSQRDVSSATSVPPTPP